MTPNIALRSADRRQGAALIITLFFIVIITTLAVAYMTSSRMERSASNSHFERSRATSIARSAVDQVVATLQRETSDPSRNWVSQPGMLTVASGKDATRKTLLDETVYLSSGAPSSVAASDPVFEPANLNVQTLQDQGRKTYLVMDAEPETQPDGSILNQPIEMKLRWVYVRKDGRLELENPDAPISSTNLPREKPSLLDKANPIVGRFAYWADDESSKLNANMAWTRDPQSLNQNLSGHPTKIDLRALPDFDKRLSNNWTIGDAVHNSVTNEADAKTRNYQVIRRFFNTPLDVRRMAQPTLISQLGLQSSDADLLRIALDRNKFNLTHYNNDPDTTYYGKSRMVLTTQLADAVIRDEDGNLIMVNGKPLHRPFLDILKRSSDTDLRYIDPGYGNPNVIDVDKLNKVIHDLIDNYLKKDDWPMVNLAGADRPSVQLKYYRNYPANVRDQRLAQLALNIIEYVRSAESAKTVVEPIRGRFIPEGGENLFIPDFHPGTGEGGKYQGKVQGLDDTFKGIVRSPYITEMGFWMADKPEAPGKLNAGRYRCIGFLEVYLPPDYGIDEIDLLNTEGLNWKVWFSEFQRTTSVTQPDGSKKSVPYYYTWDEKPANQELSVLPRTTFFVPTTTTSKDGAVFVWEAVGAGNTGKSKLVGPNQYYRTIAFEAFKDVSLPDGANPINQRPIAKMSLRTAITLTGSNSRRIDVTPLSNEGTEKNSVWVLPNAPGVMPTDIVTWETVDPRVNGLAKDWQYNGSVSANTLGRQNNAWTSGIASGTYRGGGVGGTPIGVLPEQDRDKNGKVSAASLRMPYPRGHTKNPTGRVRSPGELGLIHTGIEGSNAATLPGIPWRTLHLQPSTQGTTVVPDWAFMDLFTVPADVPQKASLLFAPHSSSTGGRVNMNAKPEPFEEIDRIDPLAAVLYGCRTNTLNNTTLTLPQAKQIAQNIYKRVPAAKSTLPAGKHYPSNSPIQVYDSPGEVVEMMGVADGGEESEELVREIANLITARGNVFSIYTIGQALKQTPDGRLLVTAEQRQQAVVERYLIDKNTPDPSDDEIGFRSVYFRNLTP